MRKEFLFAALAAVFGGSIGLANADIAVPRPTYQLDGNRLILPGPIVFKTGTAELSSESNTVLQ